jgi:hypothetical protein
MKVTAITPTKNTKTGGDMWRVQFEEDTKSMWLGFAPTFTAGDTIDDAKIQVSSTGKSWVFRKKEESTSTTPETPKTASSKTYGKTPEEQASIERQVDKKVSAEIYGYHIERGVPFQGQLLSQIYKAVRGLGKDLVEAIKKEGGVESA